MMRMMMMMMIIIIIIIIIIIRYISPCAYLIKCYNVKAYGGVDL
jgi:hypothetical protein